MPTNPINTTNFASLKAFFDSEAFPLLLAVEPSSPMRFDAQFLKKYVKLLHKELREAIDNIAYIPFKKNVPVFKNKELAALYGDPWDGHCLHHNPVFWYTDLSEANITKLLQHTFNNGSGPGGVHAFIDALYRTLGKNDECAPAENIDVECFAEKFVKCEKDSGRMDLFFIWGMDTDARAIVVEAKFGAPLNNPLKCYREYAKNKLNNKAPLPILLLQSALKFPSDKELEKMKVTREELEAELDAWHIVYWDKLIKVWEEVLSEKFNVYTEHLRCHDNAARVRKSIWYKICGVHNE